MVGLGAGDHPDRATRMLQGRGDKGVLRAAGEGQAGQPVARRQGPPVDATQPGAGVGGAAAEHGRGEEAAGHRQVGHALRAAQLQAVARLQHRRRPGREPPHVTPHANDAPGEFPRQRHAHRPARGTQRGAGEQHLQPRRTRRAAGQVVGGGQQQRVEGPGERYADAAVAGPAGVLHRHAEAGGDDLEGGAHGSSGTVSVISAASARLATARKRTRSPAASRAGRVALPASNSPTPVRPTSRQPPGLSQG